MLGNALDKTSREAAGTDSAIGGKRSWNPFGLKFEVVCFWLPLHTYVGKTSLFEAYGGYGPSYLESKDLLG